MAGYQPYSRNKLKSHYVPRIKGSHRWDIDSQNDARLLSFRYAPLAAHNAGETVLCRMQANRMDVIFRNKNEAIEIIKYQTLPAIIEEVKKSSPQAREILFPYSEFMKGVLGQFSTQSKMMLEEKTSAIDNKPTPQYMLALKLNPAT